MRRKKEDALPCLENERRREEEGKMNETELEGKTKEESMRVNWKERRKKNQ